MTIEQTKWFKMEVDHLVKFGKENRYMVGREQMAKELVLRTAHYRGADVTNKLIAKANQRLHFKFYEKV